MATQPAGFSQAYANRQIISDLGLLNDKSYGEFVKLYPSLAKDMYLVKRIAQGAMVFSGRRKFGHYVDDKKNLPAFEVEGAVTGSGAGANITVTLAAASHANSGALSPIEAGQQYRNNTSGQMYYVVSVSKSTPSAHTAVLRPVDSAVTAAVVDGDYLLYFPQVVGEKSTKTKGLYPLHTEVTNEVATIRLDEEYTDWSMFEKTDLPGEAAYYKNRANKKNTEAFTAMSELLLIMGIPYSNLSAQGIQNNHKGLLKQMSERGQIDSTSTAIDDAFFTNLTRLIDAEGASDSYDFLVDTELRIKIDAYLRAEYGQSGGIVWGQAYEGDGLEINANVQSYTIDGNKYNFMKYGFFNSARIWGAPINTGVHKNFGLLIPRGEGVDAKSGENIEKFRVRFTGESASAPYIRHWTTGALSPNKTDDEMVLREHHYANMGIECFQLNQFVTVDLNV